MKTPSLFCVDVGYGYTKPLKQKAFSSVVVETNTKDFFQTRDNIEGNNPFLISFDDKIYALGETAHQLTRNPSTIMERSERWKHKEYQALMLGGIIQQLPKGDIEESGVLVTGLPYLQSKNESEVNGLKKTFIREWRIATLEDNNIAIKKVNIVDVYVLSQPRGAYYSLLSLTGKRIKSETALICDLGFKSLDYLVTINGQETPDSNGEDSIAGMERVYTELIKLLRGKGLPAISPHEFDSWLSKGYLNQYTTTIENVLNRAAKTIINDIKFKLGTMWERIEMIGSIYFVGGSSKRLQPYLQKQLPDSNIYFAENSQQLIVEGYGAYGRAMLRKLYGGVNNV